METKAANLSPALSVPRKKMPATGIVAIWLAGVPVWDQSARPLKRF